jgi:DNA polymerase-3 subunit epsilon
MPSQAARSTPSASSLGAGESPGRPAPAHCPVRSGAEGVAHAPRPAPVPSAQPPVRRVAIIDFETTGLRAGPDRIIEVGAALLEDGVVVATFSELMDPGRAIPSFVTGLTGISDAMVRGKPRPEAVMPRLRAFLGEDVCVAHNASFDQRFHDAEMGFAGQAHQRSFLCSMLLARRLVQQAPDHQLGTLVRHCRRDPPPGQRAHRALADVLMTCQLWSHLLGLVRARLGGRAPGPDLLRGITRTAKGGVDAYLAEAARGPALCR